MKQVLKQLVENELNKIFKQHDYWGTEEQIDNEMLILEQSGVEATDEESIEEYYLRILEVLYMKTRLEQTEHFKDLINNLENRNDKIALLWTLTNSKKINRRQFKELLSVI